MVICSNCGVDCGNNPKLRFCADCGAPVGAKPGGGGPAPAARQASGRGAPGPARGAPAPGRGGAQLQRAGSMPGPTPAAAGKAASRFSTPPQSPLGTAGRGGVAMPGRFGGGGGGVGVGGRQAVAAAAAEKEASALYESVPALAGEQHGKKENKPDPVKLVQAKQWLEQLTGKKCTGTLQQWLRSGVILCESMNRINPIIPNIHKDLAPFKQQENIANYLEACRQMGVKECDLFMTADLYENTNMKAVVDNIHAVGSVLKNSGGAGGTTFQGPLIGVKQSEQYKDPHADARTPVHVVLVGDPGVGKTSLLVAYCTGDFSRDVPGTYSKDLVPRFRAQRGLPALYSLSVSDVRGGDLAKEEKLVGELTKANVIAMCFSLVDRNSLSQLASTWLPVCNQYASAAPKILIGCKADLLASVNVDQSVKLDTPTVEQTKQQLGWKVYVSCSANSLQNLAKVFVFAVEVFHKFGPKPDSPNGAEEKPAEQEPPPKPKKKRNPDDPFDEGEDKKCALM